VSAAPWRPSEEERRRVAEAVSRAVEAVEGCLARSGVEFDEVRAVGSTAKDTFLPGDSDVDVVVVSEDVDGAFRAVSSCLPGSEKKGDLKIWRARVGGGEVDVVVVHPSRTRRWFTLRHAEIYSGLSERQRDDVRRLKAYLKSRCAYGAEVGGVTGVAAEEMVRRFGSAEEACRRVVESDSPFWLQDPAAEEAGVKRNLLASVTQPKWELAREACRALLAGEELEDYSCRFERVRPGWTIIDVERPHPQRDRSFQAGWSACLSACRELRAAEPDVEECSCDAYVDGGRLKVAFKVRPEQLPPTREACVPPWAGDEAVEAFKARHPGHYVREDGYVCAQVERRVTRPAEFVARRILDRLTGG